MPPLPKISGKELARVTIHLGFQHIHTRGSHMIFKHSDGRIAVIPVHSNEEIGPGLLNKIIKKDLQISREQFIEVASRI